MLVCKWCKRKQPIAECFLCPRCKKPLCGSCRRCQGDGHELQVRRPKARPVVSHRQAGGGTSRRSEIQQAAGRRRAAAAAYAEQARHMVRHVFGDPSGLARSTELPAQHGHGLNATPSAPEAMNEALGNLCPHGMQTTNCAYCARRFHR
jgi:hypothetical protein